MKLDVLNKLTRTSNKLIFKAKKHSPAILMVAGTVGVVTSTVLACKATTKLETITNATKEKVDAIHEAVDVGEINGVEYTQEDSKKDLTIVYTQNALQIAKLYAPSVIVGALSIGCFLTSHRIMRTRNLALSAAFGALSTEFKEYRGRVAERFGKDIERQIKYNIKQEAVEKTVVDENGNESTVTELIDVVDEKNLSEYSEFARFFDVGNPHWQKDPEDNLWFLKQQERYANEKLQRQGYLFLNDVYDSIGIPKTKAGQVVGWIYDKNTDPNDGRDNYVDFGIFDGASRAARDFVNGYERTILLDFNVDGNIWENM